MVSLILAGAALLCWPDNSVTTRLRAIAGRTERKRLRARRPNALTLTIVAAVTGWLVAGPAGAVAAALLTLTIRGQLRTRAASRDALTAVDGLAEAMRTLVAGLHAGAHPARAAEAAAADAHTQTRATMRAIASAASLDGDLAVVVHESPALAPPLARLATAWQLAQRHGLPLADVLDAVRRDLEQRARFTRQVLARMAGPRSSALALSLLPVLGLALGTATGANPLAVLMDTPLGQASLVVGVTLLCAGMAWSARITTRAVPA